LMYALVLSGSSSLSFHPDGFDVRPRFGEYRIDESHYRLACC
jgi:rRNA maturation protein Nop10